MHTRTQEILSYLDARRASLKAAAANVSTERQSEQPGADRWSVAQVIEHLTMVESRVDSLIIKQLAGAQAAGLARDEETSPVVPSLDVSGLLNRTEKLVARENSLPAANLTAEQAMSKLDADRAALRSAIVDADGLALGTIMADHPRLGPLNLYQWLVFLGAHEERHIAQIQEVAQALA